MATLINGDGNAAVYAAQDSDWFAGVEGNTTKILKVGAKMEYEIEDANTIAIKNGVLITKEGRRVQIDAGAIDEFIIPTGTQGVTRYFIIGYHLYTDASSNQLCETFVQLMANDTDTIPEDTFRGGSTDVYVSLYRVKQDGITLDTIQSLLPEGVDLDGIGDEIDDIKDDINQINSDLTELSYREPDETFTATSSTTHSDVAKWLATKLSKFTPFTTIYCTGTAQGIIIARWSGQGAAFRAQWVAYNGLEYGVAFTYVSDAYASAWAQAAGGTWTNISTTACPNLVLKLWY